MIIYKSVASEFDLDVRYNKITEKLEQEFKRILGRGVSDSERRAFTNSLSRMNDILINEKLVKKDCGILIEYQLPSSSMRLDFMITGRDKFNNKNAVIVELKQWDDIQETNTARQVFTYTGGSLREVNHPAVQVYNYKSYLQDYHSAFHKGRDEAVKLFACSYLHNYKIKEADKLIDLKFKSYMDECPVYTSEHAKQIGEFIRVNVEKGDGIEIVDYIEKSPVKPSKKLIDHINNIVNSKSEFILVGQQLVVYDRVMQLVNDKKLDHTDGKYVVIVKGGPGTGKSVVGLNLLARILNENKECAYLAANAAFKNGMANKIDKDRAKALFKHPYFFNRELVEKNKKFQTVIVDEAHRISDTPPPMQRKLNRSLVEEVIDKTALSVFFTDDNQMIRPKDIGSYSHVKEAAEAAGAELFEYELDAQFRCAGSEGYLNWLDDVLGIRETANASGWENMDDLEFHIVDDPKDMRCSMIDHQAMGATSRIVAGYAWPWSKELNSDGTLQNDVVVFNGDDVIFEMPWNPQDTYSGKRRAKGIPSGTANWAINPDGVNQIGCIHTCQGLEFDYIGVIIGKEFTYNPQKEAWEADVAECHDKKIGKNSQKDFLRLAQNTYKTLLTRGMKGVVVHSVDAATQQYLKDRLKVVRSFEDSRFYHKKDVEIDILFEEYYVAVAEEVPTYKAPLVITTEQYNFRPFEEGYHYCDLLDDRSFYETISKIIDPKYKFIEDELLKLLNEAPQIRYFTRVYNQVLIKTPIMTIEPLAIVKRRVRGESVTSVVFRA